MAGHLAADHAPQPPVVGLVGSRLNIKLSRVNPGIAWALRVRSRTQWLRVVVLSKTTLLQLSRLS
jgi:hypothetical protein